MREGVKHVGKVDAWATTDGEHFLDVESAEKHQKDIDEEYTKGIIAVLAAEDCWSTNAIDTIVEFTMKHKEQLVALLKTV